MKNYDDFVEKLYGTDFKERDSRRTHATQKGRLVKIEKALQAGMHPLAESLSCPL